MSNLALACRACNVRKGEAIDGIDSDTGETIPLFDPRADRWADHFSFDPDTSEIRPLTAVARVTIARLDINHPYQIAARHVWAKFGLYP